MKYNFFFLVVFVFIIVSRISSDKNDTGYKNIIKSNHEKIIAFYNRLKNSCSTQGRFFVDSISYNDKNNIQSFNDFILFIDEQKKFKQFEFDLLQAKKEGVCVYLKNNYNFDNKIIDSFDFYLSILYFQADNSRHNLYNPYYGYGTAHANINLLKNYHGEPRIGDLIISLTKDEIEIITMLRDKKYFTTKIIL